MTEHTPGPWETKTHGKAAYLRMYIGKTGLPHSATGYAEFSVQPYGRPKEALANARLIAAAPDLLAVLEAVFQKHAKPAFQGDPFTLQPEWQKARTALAKARGE